jgi:hypothetical protein
MATMRTGNTKKLLVFGAQKTKGFLSFQVTIFGKTKTMKTGNFQAFKFQKNLEEFERG